MTDEFERRKKAVLAPIYFEAGASLHACQSFEYAIAYLLYLLSRLGTNGIDVAQCVAIMDNEKKKTAGQLIGMLRKHIVVSEELEVGLVKALAARNQLIHRYLIDNVERMADIQTHDAMVKEIRALRAAVRSAQKQLHPFIQALAQLLDGVSLDSLAADLKAKFLRDTCEH